MCIRDRPYGIPYSKEDFRKINDLLFPIPFRKDLEIFSWNDDFSNYFDDGDVYKRQQRMLWMQEKSVERLT